MITSNVNLLIEKLTQLKTQLPGDINKSLNADRYRESLKLLAETVMMSMAETDQERAAVPIISGTIAARNTEHGFEFSLNGISFETIDPLDFLKDVHREEIVDWVSQHKELKPERDYYRTGPMAGQPYPAENLAGRVVAAIDADPDPWFRTDVAGHGALNPEGLVSLVGLTQLPPNRLTDMLRSVLRIWSDYVRERAPHEVRFRIRSLLK